MTTLKDMLNQAASIQSDGVSVKIVCESMEEREALLSRLTSIAVHGGNVETLPEPVNPVTQVVLVKALLVYDDEGNYFIHGTSKDDSSTMFKSMAGIWSFDPSKEMVREIELELELPRVDGVMKPKVL